MKSFTLFIIVFFSFVCIAQILNTDLREDGFKHTKDNSLFRGDPLPGGTYTIGVTGNFNNINDAFSKLINDGIAGPVIFELIDTLYTPPTGSTSFILFGPITGADQDSRVTIKPAANKKVIIRGNGKAVLNFSNIKYITIDGVGLTGSTTLTVYSILNTQVIRNSAIDFNADSDHNIVQNVTLYAEDNTRNGCGIGFWPSFLNCDSNLVQNNFIRKAHIGINFFEFTNAGSAGAGNIIRNNIIGSDADSLIGIGIFTMCFSKTIIENNIIRNIKGNPFQSNFKSGILSVAGVDEVIRNNIVHDIKGTNPYIFGIGLTGGYPAVVGSNNKLYNNMIFDLQGENDSILAGIFIELQNDPEVYFNTVFLNGSGASYLGSAALWIYPLAVNKVISKNNILVNTRDESPYCASAVIKLMGTFESNYNDLYYNPNPYNCLVRTENTDYYTLPEWRVSGNDINSISELPHFTGSNLHINPSFPTNLESNALPLNWIMTDIDGDQRNTLTPDIGADEFIGTILNVEENCSLSDYRLEQNYPNPFNPSTLIKYSIPQLSNVKITVYNVIGEEIAILLNEKQAAGDYELEWNAGRLKSGVYFYKLNSGAFSETKKMIYLK